MGSEGVVVDKVSKGRSYDSVRAITGPGRWNPAGGGTTGGRRLRRSIHDGEGMSLSSRRHDMGDVGVGGREGERVVCCQHYSIPGWLRGKGSLWVGLTISHAFEHRPMRALAAVRS